MPPPEIRHAMHDDVHTLGITLAKAFDDDPLTTWLFPRADVRRRRLPRFFRAMVRTALGFGEVYTGGDGRCAAVWNPPGTFPMGARADARLGAVTAALVGPRIIRCARGLLYFAAHHPKERHWYLQLIGTRPEDQGQGLGSAVMAPVLERCDRDGERVYLESSKKDNIPFYERHGFRVTEEMTIPGGDLVVWAMWRDPR